MPNYRASELDQRVSFSRKVRTPDGAGGYTSTLVEIATVWAHVRPMSGREREHSMTLNAQSNYLIVIRNRDDIDETAVAVWKGVTFNLRFAKTEARSRWLPLEAERGVPS